MHKATEFFEISTALAPDADRWTGSPATDVYNMKYWSNIAFFITEGAGGVGTTKITAEECTSKAAAGAAAIPIRYRMRADRTDAWGAWTSVAVAATGYTLVAGASKEVMISIDAAELSDGYPFVRLQTAEVDSTAVDAAIIAVLSGPRYPQETLDISVS